MSNKNYYIILNIPFGDPSSSFGKLPSITKQQLKIAYHKALLKYHPDKSSSPSPALPKENAVYTIDDITNAYKTLSDPELRAEYDRELILRRKNGHSFGAKVNGHDENGVEDDEVLFHTGLEVVDLEDLEYYDADAENAEEGNGLSSSYWYRSCRCGDEKGFIVTEDELEAEAQHGEILVGCRGCSLWMKVLYAVAEDGEEVGEEESDSANHAMEGS